MTAMRMLVERERSLRGGMGVRGRIPSKDAGPSKKQGVRSPSSIITAVILELHGRMYELIEW